MQYVDNYFLPFLFDHFTNDEAMPGNSTNSGSNTTIPRPCQTHLAETEQETVKVLKKNNLSTHSHIRIMYFQGTHKSQKENLKKINKIYKFENEEYTSINYAKIR